MTAFNSYAGKTLVQMKIHANEQAAEIERLRDALIWCGGSQDFSPGGIAREGWERVVHPLITPHPNQQDKGS